MGKFNFDEFLKKERRLDTIVRFGTHIRLKDESISEHSFHTALYAMILADLEKQFGNKVNVERLLRTALVHDMEECLTGDIIYGFKHIHPSLTKQIKKISSQFLEELMENLPSKISKQYMELWKNAKSNELEGKIIDGADKLEGLIYSLNELSLGNKAFKPVIDTYIKHLKSLKLKSVNIILKQLKFDHLSLQNK